VQSAAPKTAVAVLGATGSIGQATLSVLSELGDGWRAVGISAHSSVQALAELAQEAQPQWVAVTSERAAEEAKSVGKFPPGCQVLTGPDALVQIAEAPEVDTLVAAIVGSAGLMSTLAAAQAGKRLALANKEALVVAGKLVTEAVASPQGVS
jgi:1-deoxy-D-xylulose-5-phosphate reductoisomerase